MNILILTVGLPRSGKSTWARQYGAPIVNPDAIRLALHGQRFQVQAEPMVWAIARYMVEALFLAGHTTVILDATNVTFKRRNEWSSNNWVCRFEEFRTPAQECKQRALNSDMPDLLPVIDRMAAQTEWPTS